MNTKFTEGKWDVGTSKDMVTGVVSHTINSITGGMTMNQGINNAYLIAAAPDMYAEIHSDLDRLKGIISCFVGHDLTEIKKDIKRKEKLLAKARGEL